MTPCELTDDEIEAFDEEFARRFAQASHEAYNRALNAGIPVAVSSGGVLWQVVKKDGKITRTRIKDLPPEVPVRKGAKILIRW